MPTTMIATNVSSETASWLESQARAHGLDRGRIAAAVLEDAARTGAAPLVDATSLSPQERLRRFDALMAKVPARPGPPVDTSRDSIYD